MICPPKLSKLPVTSCVLVTATRQHHRNRSPDPSAVTTTHKSHSKLRNQQKWCESTSQHACRLSKKAACRFSKCLLVAACSKCLLVACQKRQLVACQKVPLSLVKMLARRRLSKCLLVACQIFCQQKWATPSSPELATCMQVTSVVTPSPASFSPRRCQAQECLGVALAAAPAHRSAACAF